MKITFRYALNILCIIAAGAALGVFGTAAIVRFFDEGGPQPLAAGNAARSSAVSNALPLSLVDIDGDAFHVIVAGGEPEGVAAALSAARNGAKVLLVEEGEALGGLMTLGMLNYIDLNFGPDGELLTQGIFMEFYEDLGDSFDIDKAKGWFLEKCNAEPNITVMLSTEILSPVMEGGAVIGLEIKEAGRHASRIVRCLALIDATADGDVAAAAGVPYTTGGEDYGSHRTVQGATLVFELGGVDWDAVVDHIRSEALAHTGASENAAWGYSEEVKGYVPAERNVYFRAPNVAKLDSGNVLLNGLIIFGIDAHDPTSYAEGIARGRREIGNIIEFVRRSFRGFENAYFVSHASRLYVRESRHFIGEYRLTITDVLENRDHWDRIGHGSYPVDVQASGMDNLGTVYGVPLIYSIPFRCLVPLEVDGLLIAGRSASYDSLPHGSARVIPVGMVTGEACGAAAAYSVMRGVAFRQMSKYPEAIAWLQYTLKSQGAYLVEYDPPRAAVMDHWAYPGLVVMRELGMASGGYNNEYRLDEELPDSLALEGRINGLMRLINERSASRGLLRVPVVELRLDGDMALTVGRLLSVVAQYASLGEWVFDDYSEARDYLEERGVLDAHTMQHFSEAEDAATLGQLYYLLGGLYAELMDHDTDAS